MGEPGSLHGAIAQVKYTYLTAAVVTGFVVKRDELTGAWLMSGTLASSDAYLLGQRDLKFVVRTTRGSWRWPVTSCTVVQGQIHARLGALL